jgi:hypothetical protein
METDNKELTQKVEDNKKSMKRLNNTIKELFRYVFDFTEDEQKIVPEFQEEWIISGRPQLNC